MTIVHIFLGLLLSRFKTILLNSKILPWMFRSKDIPLLGHGNVRIDFCNIDWAMPQHLLYISDIDIRLQKTCGKSVPEHVRCNVQINCRKRSVFVNHPAHSLIGQFPAILLVVLPCLPLHTWISSKNGFHLLLYLLFRSAANFCMYSPKPRYSSGYILAVEIFIVCSSSFILATPNGLI